VDNLLTGVDKSPKLPRTGRRANSTKRQMGGQPW
jgi:hypothetical protein